MIDDVSDGADEAAAIVALVERDRQKLHRIGRGSATALRIHDLAARFVLLSIPHAARQLALSEPTVAGGVRRLEQAGILREATGRRRGRLYAYDEYLKLLNEGTVEPES